jgi:uncharacterized protein (DUF1697 family)
MTAYVALLRGINVGGNNKLPMIDFRELLEEVGCKDVATYIQSGNAVFKHKKTAADLSEKISAAVHANFGFRPSVMVLTASNFADIAAANPFLVDVSEPKHLHVWFLGTEAVDADTDRLDDTATDSEKYLLTDSAFYLHAPDGIGRSKLGAGVERCLGVAATARNWRTVSKIGEMLDALAQ